MMHDVIISILGLAAEVGAGIASAVLVYRAVFIIAGMLTTRKFKAAGTYHKYAVLIAARNEERVIGSLLESIRQQRYPKDKLAVFVVADNCTDRTAEVARAGGAICYERFDSAHRTKGYALQYLVECIRRDYGIEAWEGYFLFDADNLLAPDYLARMNDAFDAGEKIVTSYRNTKNFSDNRISASYGIHWLRTVRFEHRARSLFRLATRIQGTGFLFSHELIREGWRFTSLTEDRAFCADAVAGGYQISYQHEAVFYDEQPTSLKIALRQRIRWAKGHIQALFQIGPKLFLHIFHTGGRGNLRETTRASIPKRILNNLRFRFMCLDMLTVFSDVILIFTLPVSAVYILCTGPEAFSGAVKDALRALAGNCILNVVTAVYILFAERRRIADISPHKAVRYAVAFPLFDLIGAFSAVIALFTPVEWKPIPHCVNVKITELSGSGHDASTGSDERTG